MAKMVYNIVTPLQEAVDNRLSADPESLIERMIREVASSPQTTA